MVLRGLCAALRVSAGLPPLGRPRQTFLKDWNIDIRSHCDPRVVSFFVPYNLHSPPSRQTPQPSHPRDSELDFGPFRVRFSSVWLRLAPFGSVSGPFRGVGWGQGGVRAGSGRGASVLEYQKTREGCGCPKFAAGKVFRQISTLLENDSPIFRQREMLSLPRFGHFPTFRQGKRLLENWPRLRERCWIFSSETATAFLSSSVLE